MGKFRISIGEDDLLEYGRSTEAKKALLDKLKKLDEGLGSLLDAEKVPEDLGLERLEFREKGEEELEEEAESALREDYERALAKLKEDFGRKREALESSRPAAEAEGEALRDRLEENYDRARENVEEDVLKRGLARSSAAAGQLGALERERAAGRQQIDRAVTGRLEELSEQIASLSEELDRAVGEQDAAHAREVAERLDSLREEQEKRREEVAKYNNTVAEKESKYKLDRELKLADKLTEAVAGSKGEKAREVRSYQKALAIRDYLDEMPIDAAMALLTKDRDIRAAAGAYYHYLVNYLKLKARGAVS